MKHKWTKRMLAGLLALVTVLAMSACSAPAADEEAADDETSVLTVYVTVSDQGEIAVADDGTLMANVPIKLDMTGKEPTVHDAMIALHQMYKEDGYAIQDGFTNKLWGVETSNNLFFLNYEGLSEAVDATPIHDGDRITAALLKDDRYYSDIFAYFSDVSQASDIIEMKLMGLGREADAKPVPVGNAQIGFATKDGFQPMEGAVTDLNGDVTVDLSKYDVPTVPYVITAQGTMATTATDWSAEGTPTVDVDAPLIAGAVFEPL